MQCIRPLGSLRSSTAGTSIKQSFVLAGRIDVGRSPSLVVSNESGNCIGQRVGLVSRGGMGLSVGSAVLHPRENHVPPQMCGELRSRSGEAHSSDSDSSTACCSLAKSLSFSFGRLRRSISKNIGSSIISSNSDKAGSDDGSSSSSDNSGNNDNITR